MPGLEISDKDRRNIDAKFFCSICSLLLVQPVQTLCGHLFCFSCVEDLFKKSSAVCPLDGSKVAKDEVFPDNFTRREVLDLNIHCPDECGWSGTVKALDGHRNNCRESLVRCVHNQCDRQIRRSFLGKHLKEDCLYRPETCPDCRVEFPLAALQKHRATECPAFPSTCKHCEKGNIPRCNMKKHEILECGENIAECDFKYVGCKEMRKRKDLKQHLSDGLMCHVRLLLDFVLDICEKIKNLMPQVNILKGTLAELKRVTETLSSEVTSILKAVTGLERRVDGLESKAMPGENQSKMTTVIKSLENKVLELTKTLEKALQKNLRTEGELQEKVLIIERLRTQLERVDQSLALTTIKLSDMESTKRDQQLISYNGTLLWRIEGFNRKRQDAVSGVQTAIYSPHFYSSQFGYRMCARIYMNGDGFGKASHISLFFVVMRGEYDALLTWPFQKKITMMLLDQTTGDHIVDSFRSDIQSSSFQRPKTEMNIASGSPLFMPLNALNNRTYVKDDIMFVKIIVD